MTDTTSRGSLSRLELAAIVAIAAVPRLLGLGHVSLWLDEILSTLRVGRNLGEAWQAWRGNPVHPPLSELLQWLWFRVVEPEPLRRLLPIALGVLTVVLLAHLVSRWFGRRAAWATALIAAFSPLHVRYSQELRGYALGLLALTIALLATEVALERRRWSGWVILGLALALCYWSMYLSAIALVPIVLTTLQTVSRPTTSWRNLIGFAAALVLSLALFSPWLSIVERAAAMTHEQQATAWTWSLAGQRWQFLTVGGVEGDSLSAGAMLFAALVAFGIVAAAGRSRGRAVIAGALAGSAGVEVVLWLTDHWSNGRYNLASWPFLVMLAGLGGSEIYRLTRRRRAFGAMLAASVLLAMLVFQMIGLAHYFRRGRPDWHSVARVVSAAAAPDRPVMVANEWTRVSLGYYLAQLDGTRPAGVSSRVGIMGSDVEASELTGEDCTLLVAAGWSRSQAIEGLLLKTPARRDFPRSGARIAALPLVDDGTSPWRCLPAAVDALAGERPSPRWLRTFERRGEPGALEMTAEDQPNLRFGWSYPESTPSGMTFRWAVGRWAAIDLPIVPGSSLGLEVWSLHDDQVMTVYLGRRPLGAHPLSTTRQTIEVPWPDGTDHRAVVFGFSRHAGPEENPRPLAVAFDRIEPRP